MNCCWNKVLGENLDREPHAHIWFSARTYPGNPSWSIYSAFLGDTRRCPWSLPRSFRAVAEYSRSHREPADHPDLVLGENLKPDREPHREPEMLPREPEQHRVQRPNSSCTPCVRWNASSYSPITVRAILVHLERTSHSSHTPRSPFEQSSYNPITVRAILVQPDHRSSNPRTPRTHLAQLAHTPIRPRFQPDPTQISDPTQTCFGPEF